MPLWTKETGWGGKRGIWDFKKKVGNLQVKEKEQTERSGK